MECKGCIIDNRCTYKKYANYTFDGISYSCPCQTCLIKGICCTACDEYEEYRRIAVSTFASEFDIEGYIR